MLAATTPMLARLSGSATKPEAHPARALLQAAQPAKPLTARRLGAATSPFDSITEDPTESAQAATSPAASSKPLVPRTRVRPNWMTLEPIADE